MVAVGCATQPASTSRIVSPDPSVAAEIEWFNLANTGHLYISGSDGNRHRVLTTRRGGALRATWKDERTILVAYDDTADLSCPDSRIRLRTRDGDRMIQILLRPYGPLITDPSAQR